MLQVGVDFWLACNRLNVRIGVFVRRFTNNAYRKKLINHPIIVGKILENCTITCYVCVPIGVYNGYTKIH